MDIFAHNGVEHTSAADAAAHSASASAAMILIVTITAAALMGAAYLAVRRLASEPVKSEEDKD